MSRLLIALLSLLLAQGPPPQPTFEDLLKKFTSARANPCESDLSDPNLSGDENRLFDAADQAVVEQLNAKDQAVRPAALATTALRRLKGLGEQINHDWPEDKRFDFKVTETPPAILVQMTYRNRATFSFFAIPNKPGKRWQYFGAQDDHRSWSNGFEYDSVGLTPLIRGPSKRVRFLATFHLAGCGSGEGVGYYAYQWNPERDGTLDEIIKLEGSESRLEATDKEPFKPIGRLRTDGQLITLPYCRFSTIDTWDNPNLCAVDSYDISGDRARFSGTVVNRPDLLPIASAVKYAQEHDYPAVLAYCESAVVARKMMKDVPIHVFGPDVLVKRLSPSSESVEIGDDPSLRFVVVKHGDRWKVASFRLED